jgi:hypothetical protein
MSNTEREELARIIGGKLITRSSMTETAGSVIAAGYRRPKVLGYVVVSRDGRMLGHQFGDRAAAQARADEWTNDCKTGGVDWDYRVAEIVEAAQ